MSKYNYKTIAVVPTAKDFIDVILSKTQRKTPTQIHPQFKISRIRGFYMRKIKYTQQNFHERITGMLQEFPVLDEVHPFYADLINVLYSRDHYKLALGQLNVARTLIDNISKDYLKLLKFGDSPYRCKELKRAALGRMCTLIKKLGPSLAYLEQVRQHLSRLPSIDPATRTVLVTGYPNVGKSSFVNKVSEANTEVQPYPFTTKSLFVGHFDYKYMRWQVIDTPGILDHPLEDRNNIEMQAVTALAHLGATVLFFIDVSESCGYSLKQQASLFHSIKPLFANKPVLIVASKADVKKLEDLTDEEKALVDGMRQAVNTKIVSMSNETEEGIQSVVELGCNMLLGHRTERKLTSTKRLDDIKHRIHIATPTPRDNKKRGAEVPASVAEEKRLKALREKTPVDEEDPNVPQKPARKLMKQIELENGGPGIFNFDWRNWHQLRNDEWKFDVVPEIIDGKNVADFYDPDIEEKLAALEAEEAEELKAWEQFKADRIEEEDLDDDQKADVDKIRRERKIIKATRQMEKTNNKPVVPRTARPRDANEMQAKLGAVGLDASKAIQTARAKSKEPRSFSKGAREEKRGRKRTRDSEMDTEDGEPRELTLREKSQAARSRSRTPAPKTPQQLGMADEKQQTQAKKLKVSRDKVARKMAKGGEGDRRYLTAMPKHLFAGKRQGQSTSNKR